jgi:hypothetical protein
MTCNNLDFYDRIRYNRKVLSSGNFTWDDLPEHIQKQVDKRRDIYVLKTHEWVQVAGYEIFLTKEVSIGGEPYKIKIKYPPTVRFYRLRNFFAFLQRGIWVHDYWCRVPFTSIVIAKWEVGDHTSKSVLLATFIGRIGGGPNVGG